MRSTTVKALAVSNGRKIFRVGDNVTEANFAKGEFDKLIEKGFLNPAGADDGKKVKLETIDDEQPDIRFGDDVVSPNNSKVDGPADQVKPPLKVVTDENLDDPEKDLEKDNADPSLNQMRKELKERGVTVPPNAKKEDIIKLWAAGK